MIHVAVLDDDNPGIRYAPLATAFAISASALAHQAIRRDREPPGGLELGESILATYFLARLVAKERIGSVLREPFVEPAPGTDPADGHGEAKQPTGDGLRRSIGELVTCTRCLGPWAAAALTFGQAFAPRHARIATRILALAGANTLVQAAHAATTTVANREVSG